MMISPFTALEVEIAPPMVGGDVPEVAAFARIVGLSLFDACYLQQALVEGCGLASRDAGLLQACEKAGIETFDLRGFSTQ